jgi:hypothetical protein
MGLSAVLENETGEQLERVDDHANVLHGILPGPEDSTYRCAGFIDWYGDTTFNYLQAPLFLEDWRRLEALAGPRETAVLAAIRSLAERLRDSRHLYLKFYGD